MSDKTVISTTDAPAPMPVFSQGVRKGNILQVSGQGSVDPSGEFVFTGDVKGHIYFVGTPKYHPPLNNLPQLFVASAFLWPSRTPSGVLPSRTTVFTGLPLPDMLVEIDALAVLS